MIDLIENPSLHTDLQTTVRTFVEDLIILRLHLHVMYLVELCSDTRSIHTYQLTVPRHHLSTYGRRAFAVARSTMFNTLPDDLRDPAVSTSTFRQSLKTHLFSAYQHV